MFSPTFVQKSETEREPDDIIADFHGQLMLAYWSAENILNFKTKFRLSSEFIWPIRTYVHRNRI